MSNHLWSHEKQQFLAQSFLQDAEKQITKYPACLVTWDPDNRFYQRNQFPCSKSINGLTTFLMVEHLPTPPCIAVAVVESEGKLKLMEPNWYRVTVVLNKIKQQSLITVPSNRNSFCREITRFVNLGRQSWRQYRI